MKIIFLDIDGVLCVIESDAKQAFQRLAKGEGSSPSLNSKCISVLNRIIKKTDAKVVISSSWRLHYPLENIKKALEKHGFVGEIIGATPNAWRHPEIDYVARGNEIQQWLNEHPEVEKFVILDDETDEMRHLLPKCVVTQGVFSKGLSCKHAKLVLEHLL